MQIATTNSHIDQCIKEQKEKRYFMWSYCNMRLRAMSWTSPLVNMSKQIGTNWRMSFLKVGCPYSNACANGNQMLCFPCNNAWFDEECKAHHKMLKISKNENVLTLYCYKKLVKRKKRCYYKVQDMKKTQMRNLQPKLAWRQFKW